MDDKKKPQADNININNIDSIPVLYTDRINMSTNEDGLVLNVLQRVMSTNQLRIVSRVGMSREHAKKLVKEMGRLLAMTEGQTQTAGRKN